MGIIYENISKRRLQLRMQNLERRRRKSKKVRKIRRLSFNKRYYHNRTMTAQVTYQSVLNYKFPIDCRFFNDIDAFTIIINEIKDHFLHDSKDNVLNLDMSEVKQFDIASIIIVLTLTNYLNRLGIKVRGRTPKDPDALKMLIESDFFSHVISNQTVSKTGKDKILTFTCAGKKVVKQSLNAREIRKIVGHLTKSEKNYFPLYNLLGEIQGNSVEHANQDKNKKNWFMSIHYENDKCLIILADIGDGIINTMGLKFEQTIKKFVSGQTDSQTLLNLFKGKYQSSTKEPNRNTGLPGIFESVKKKQIGKIHVITNRAYLELSEETTGDLRNNFPGTLYSIEITKDNFNHELN